MQQDNMVSFKNAAIVGVRLNDIDCIKSIDLNQISHQDPYIFNVSSTYGIKDGQNNNNDYLVEDNPSVYGLWSQDGQGATSDK